MQVESETRRMLLDLHRDEYQIQSTRITYWITLQYATYTIGAIGLGLLVQMFGSIQLLTFILTAMLLGQVLVLAMMHVNQELFTSVVYIKQRLKPRVNRLLGPSNSHAFWEFEDLLEKERNTQPMAGFEAHFVLVVIFAVVLGVGLTSVIWSSINGSGSWKKMQFFWSFCNICVFLLITAKLPGFLRLQRALLGKSEHGRFALHDADEEPNSLPEPRKAMSGK